MPSAHGVVEADGLLSGGLGLGHQFTRRATSTVHFDGIAFGKATVRLRKCGFDRNRLLEPDRTLGPSIWRPEISEIPPLQIGIVSFWRHPLPNRQSRCNLWGQLAENGLSRRDGNLP